jgi:hypothetical protein
MRRVKHHLESAPRPPAVADLANVELDRKGAGEIDLLALTRPAGTDHRQD